MQETIKKLAASYQVSASAVEALAQALQKGGGRMAQFNHPELRGMGQWMPGMTMVGDMFNTALKAKVDALCTALLTLMPEIGLAGLAREPEMWWPRYLTRPTMIGGQDGLRYAYFAEQARLAIFRGGKITVYDTSGYRVEGLAMSQTGDQSTLYLKSQAGVTPVEMLRIVK